MGARALGVTTWCLAVAFGLDGSTSDGRACLGMGFPITLNANANALNLGFAQPLNRSTPTWRYCHDSWT
jgi:hypothetical protein